MAGPTMRETVEAQAQARVDGDAAAFSSYMTPQAVLQLGGNGMGAPALPRARRYEIVDITESVDGGTAIVRYGGRGVCYDVRSIWRLADGLWRAVEAEVPPESVRASWWRRLLGGAPSAPGSAQRKDLS
ncbi:MAG: nuclear transport factor 2 family protein [Chloroflexi bacterium]|nr:nuclear transport factor 2 family protein [Chloroflexota bacterium]